jgi:hypothetical protein
LLPFSGDVTALAQLPPGVGATGTQMRASATQSSTLTEQSLAYMSFISAGGHLDLVNPNGGSFATSLYDVSFTVARPVAFTIGFQERFYNPADLSSDAFALDPQFALTGASSGSIVGFPSFTNFTEGSDVHGDFIGSSLFVHGLLMPGQPYTLSISDRLSYGDVFEKQAGFLFQSDIGFRTVPESIGNWTTFLTLLSLISGRQMLHHRLR